MKLILLPLLLYQLSAFGFPLDTKKGNSEFLAIGRPAAIKIHGVGAGPSGEFEMTKDGQSWLLSGQAVIDLDTFDTGISMRDHHMKEKYLETGKSKNAVLKFTDARFTQAVIDQGTSTVVPAVLQMHGMEKPVEIQMKFANESGLLKSFCEFQLKISDFGIASPSFSGITMADNVQIKVETQVSRNVLNAGEVVTPK